MRMIKAGTLFLTTLAGIAIAGCNDGLVRVTPVVGGVTIVSPPASIEVGESVHLTATVSTSSGRAITGAHVYWGAEDTTILQVDSVTGVAHARAPGTTRVAASSEDMHAAVSITVPQGKLIALDSIVDDELSVTDDADEFTFRVTAPQEVNVLLRGRSGVAAQRFRLRLMGSGGEFIDSVSSGGADSVLARQAIHRAKLSQAGTYRLRVEGSLAGDRGAYQLRVQKIDTRPESVPDTAIRNNTRVKGEALTPGDVDVFTFLSTIPDQDVSVLFRALSKSPADALRVYLLTPTDNELVFVQSNGNDPFDQGSGHQLLKVPGRYSLRVQGMDAEDSGPYELEFLAINRAPERVPSPAVTANLTVALEDISPQGDIDEFTYQAETRQEVNIYFRGNDSSADTLWLRLLDSRNDTVDSVRVLGSDTSLLAHAIGHRTLAQGTWRLRVDGARNTISRYGILLRKIDLGPEGISDTLFPGPTGPVVNEAISPVGDVDEYHFNANKGDSVSVTFRATSGSDDNVLRLSLLRGDRTPVFSMEAAGGQLDQIKALKLPQSDNYIIRVQGVNSTDDGGPYRFQVVKLN